MNWLSVLLLAGIAVWVVLAVRYMIMHKGCGCDGCSGDCASCSRKCH